MAEVVLHLRRMPPDHSKLQTVAITGSNGFIGTILTRSLDPARYRCRGFDRFGGPLYQLLTTRYGQPLPLSKHERRSFRIRLIKKAWSLQKRALGRLIAKKIIRPGKVNILDPQHQWIQRFQGVDAVIHLAAIPHPHVPNMRPLDFEMVNYWGAVNIFEAAVEAGVKRFIFASSVQVYDLNHFRDWPSFPIREEVADLVQRTQTPHPYGTLKWKFENYLRERSASRGITSVALRLGHPGIEGSDQHNLWIQTSVENLVQAFDKSLQARLPAGGYVLNICDGEIPAGTGQTELLTREFWPQVPSTCVDTEPLLDLSEARKWIQYAPAFNGNYYVAETAF